MSCLDVPHLRLCTHLGQHKYTCIVRQGTHAKHRCRSCDRQTDFSDWGGVPSFTGAQEASPPCVGKLSCLQSVAAGCSPPRDRRCAAHNSIGVGGRACGRALLGLPLLPQRGCAAGGVLPAYCAKSHRVTSTAPRRLLLCCSGAGACGLLTGNQVCSEDQAPLLVRRGTGWGSCCPCPLLGVNRPAFLKPLVTPEAVGCTPAPANACLLRQDITPQPVNAAWLGALLCQPTLTATATCDRLARMAHHMGCCRAAWTPYPLCCHPKACSISRARPRHTYSQSGHSDAFPESMVQLGAR